MRRKQLYFLVWITVGLHCNAQVADFTIPDTVCADNPVFITNVQPPAAVSYLWSFCSGNASDEPDGINIGSPDQLLNTPRFITLVKDSLDYYTFTTNAGNSKLVRCYYNRFLTLVPPTIITDLGNFGLLTSQAAGIQVKKDKGTWYGFVANGTNIIRFDFGTSLLNNPSVGVIGLPGNASAFGLAIAQQDQEWIGFCTDNVNDRLFRLNFGNNLATDPQITNLGNPGQLSSPAGLTLAQENGLWYALICNPGNSAISRISFGASLTNPSPPGMALPGIGDLIQNMDVTLVSDCGGFNGFVTNCTNTSDQCIIHLLFPNGLGGPVSGYHINNNGVLNMPLGISDFIRTGDVLYAFVANYGSSTLTRMFFSSCTGASQPFYSGPDPPPVTYAEPGNYNILLTVDEGNSIQSSVCKNIVVIPNPQISLGPDRVLCQGDSALLDPGAGDSSYTWSTGASTQTITVGTPGTYWVRTVSRLNCEASDTLVVTVFQNAENDVDTTLCQGLALWVQNAYQYQPGIYRDTLQTVTGCDSIIVTDLNFRECPVPILFPNAFTPDGDGLNDVFRPLGNEITRFHMQVFDRWGAMIFETDDITTGWDGNIKGSRASPDVYSYIATFETRLIAGSTQRETGTFVLVR